MLNTPGNWLALLVIIFWPLFSLYLYRTKSAQFATAWVILGGYMLLPVKTVIDFPFIPPLGKDSIPVLSAFFATWYIQGVRPMLVLGKDRLVRLLLLMLIIGPFFTALFNSDALHFIGMRISGLTLYDGLSLSVDQCITVLALLMGRFFFRTYKSQLQIFKILVTAGLLYSLFILYEVRMSPQLHTMLYDYFPHSFAQQKRGGGFRPVVFMGHGLWVAFFTVITLIAAAALWQIKVKIRNIPAMLTHHYLLFVLVLCKSSASLIYGVFAVLMINVTSLRTQHKAAVLLVYLALLYPVLSTFNVFPHQGIINIAENISLDRAKSLEFRFDNEEVLLTHARKHLVFGWGGWGRNRVRNAETGADVSVTDGRWIIKLGVFGAVGFIAEFGLLALIVYRAMQASKILTDKKEKTILSAHALMVGIIMIDQLPNATLAPWLWLLAGILLGRSEQIINNGKKVIN